MYVGSLVVRLLIRESRTLKDKRQVVRSILDKLRANFNVSASEVAALDDVRVAALGFAMIGPEASYIRGNLQKIQEALRTHPIAEYLSGTLEVE